MGSWLKMAIYKIYFLSEKLFRQTILIFIFILLSEGLVFSQRKFEVSGGVGLPEFFNIKLKYGGKFQVGTGIGLNTYQDLNTVTISIDCYYHFAKSKITDLYTWYFNSGITYEPTNNRSGSEEESLFFYLRAGRSLYFSEHMGIELDLGFMYGYQWIVVYGRGPASYGRVLSDTKDYIFYPAGSFSYFFRF